MAEAALGWTPRPAAAQPRACAIRASSAAITAADARGKGYATLACASLLSWAWQHGACIAYLQVTADNAPAIAAYRKFGFTTAYTYHYRGRDGECA